MMIVDNKLLCVLKYAQSNVKQVLISQHFHQNSFNICSIAWNESAANACRSDVSCSLPSEEYSQLHIWFSGAGLFNWQTFNSGVFFQTGQYFDLPKFPLDEYLGKELFCLQLTGALD